MQINFQDGVDSIYDACVAKGSTPASTSLSDVVAGIMAIPTGITPSGTYTYPSGSTGTTVDITQYQYVNAANVYAKGKTDGRSMSTQTKTMTINSGSPSVSFSFSTKVVGITAIPLQTHGYIGLSSIQSNTVNFRYSGSATTLNITAIGY